MNPIKWLIRGLVTVVVIPAALVGWAFDKKKRSLKYHAHEILHDL